jgi:hypothetical protein
LRDKVVKPLLAASWHPSLHPDTQDTARIDEHYDKIRSDMQSLFGALGKTTGETTTAQDLAIQPHARGRPSICGAPTERYRG